MEGARGIEAKLGGHRQNRAQFALFANVPFDWFIGQVPGLAVTDPPAALAVEARLGLTLIKGARSEAGWLALYLLAPEGQRVLAESGFPPA